MRKAGIAPGFASADDGSDEPALFRRVGRSQNIGVILAESEAMMRSFKV